MTEIQPAEVVFESCPWPRRDMLGEQGESCPWPRRSNDRRWLIVNSEYRREATAEAEISKAGYLVYVPRFKARSRDRTKHRRWVDVVRPLFPGYMFVDCVSGTGANEVVPIEWLAKRKGVRDLVRQGERPVLVPHWVVDQLQTDERDNFLQPYRAVQAAPYAVNERVMVTEGPFTRLYGHINGFDGVDRITVLIELFGRATPVNLSADQLERA